MKIGDEVQCHICELPFIKYTTNRICPKCRNIILRLKNAVKKRKEPKEPKKPREPKQIVPKPYRKKKSAHAVGMPEFSGRTWGELEDIWPRHVRISSAEAKICGGIGLALHCIRHELKQRGIKINATNLWLLFHIQRCEDAKENVATETYPVGKPFKWNLKLYYIKQSPLMRAGLIEWLPAANRVKLLRVTALGKDVMKSFIHYLEQAHRDVKMLVADQPAENAAKVQRYLSTYCFEWDKLEDL